MTSASQEPPSSTQEPPSSGVGAVLLAAGTSVRMGTANKLLEQLDGTPIVMHALETLERAGIPHIAVVTGHDRVAVEAALGGIESVYNPRFSEGMGTSLAEGVSALPLDIDGFLVALGDMPKVHPATVRTLVAELRSAGRSAICVPTYHGRRGNPVLFGAVHRAAVLALSGDVGGKAVVARHAANAREVAVTDEGILQDVDTPEALEAARAAASRSSDERTRQ